MSKKINHLDVVAIRKSGIEGWEPYKWQMAGDDCIITGGIPRLLKSGPRKGRKTWDGKGTMVVVTRAEIASEEARYVAETGNCGTCYGEGQVFKSWHHIDGTRYQPCRKCDGTGKVTQCPAAT